MPLQPSLQGKSRKTVGMAAGQPQLCVTVTRPRHAGTGHVVHSSRVAVTVGQPVWVGMVTMPPPPALLAVVPSSWASAPDRLVVRSARQPMRRRDWVTYTDKATKTWVADFIVSEC